MFNVILYRNVNKELFNKMKPKYEFSYSYKNNGDYLPLKENSISKSLIKLEDDDEISDWNYIDYGFRIKGNIRICKAYELFFSNKIVVKDTKVGVAICWSSPESKQRGVIKLENLKKEYENKFSFVITFSPMQLLSKVKFQIMFYIDKPGKPYPNERHIANTKGNILGLFDIITVQLEGIGSLFPIYTEDTPGSPLHRLIVNTDGDLFKDQFSEVVGIYLNTSHPSYKYIDMQQTTTFNKGFLSEVIANSMATLIMLLDKEGYINDLNHNDVEDGSVMQVVNYFIQTLEWDITSFEKINESIRLYLDKRM